MAISKRKYEQTLLIITILCEITAYLLALLFRYVILKSFYPHQNGIYSFYRLFTGVLLAARVFLFYRQVRYQEDKLVWKQANIEIAATAVKQHIILLIILTVFLYFARWSSQVSRTVMGFLILFGIILDTISRIMYKNYYIRNYSGLEKKQPLILVACENETDYLTHALNTYDYINQEKEVALECIVTRHYTPQELNHFSAEKGSYLYISAKAASVLTADQKDLIKQQNCVVLWELEENDTAVLPGRIVSAGNHAVLRNSQLNHTCKVLGVNYTVTTISEAVNNVMSSVHELAGQYICFSNVHTTVMAHDDESYREVLNHAAYAFPDGNPVAKQIAKSGYPEVERVAGPDFMDQMFFATANTDIKHYFFGSTEETITSLKVQLEQRYPGIQIAGMVSPPFRALTPEEDEAAIKEINDSGASLIWIGLGAPKQEKWMAAHQNRVTGVMLGVGAGFDFHAGTIKRAPILIQKLGLEWLYRLFQNPKRLFKRYLVTNTKFLWLTRM
ncbi:MAG: WecB/TagA/CpsF family glycosyltransferase [Anaerolineaceae bacterium]|nr:WecB/TagA/CpsF family glycosyltransferase [Anaerolineaceae bacterium]